jgi:hypothetical protein
MHEPDAALFHVAKIVRLRSFPGHAKVAELIVNIACESDELCFVHAPPMGLA